MNPSRSKFTARHATALVAGAGLALAAAGYSAVAAGAGAADTAAYLRCHLETTLKCSSDKVVRAENKTIDHLHLAQGGENKDLPQATIATRSAADKKIELPVDRRVDDQTKIQIRGGTLGVDGLQTGILANIGSDLRGLRAL